MATDVGGEVSLFVSFVSPMEKRQVDDKVIKHKFVFRLTVLSPVVTFWLLLSSYTSETEKD